MASNQPNIQRFAARPRDGVSPMDADLRWQQEIHEALESIRSHLKSQDDSAARIERKIADLSLLMTGNGTPERGVIVRLDRVENVVSELKRTLGTTVSWVLRPAAGAVGLAAAGALAAWIARFGLAK